MGSSKKDLSFYEKKLGFPLDFTDEDREEIERLGIEAQKTGKSPPGYHVLPSGRPICASRTTSGVDRKTGRPIVCRQIPIGGKPPEGGNGRCRYHNGRPLRGPASPHFKHGQRTPKEYLPPGILQAWEDSQQDESLRGLDYERNLLGARRNTLLLELAEHCDEYGLPLQVADDQKATMYHKREHGKLWNQLMQTVEATRKVDGEQRKAAEEAGKVVPTPELAVIIHMLANTMGLVVREVAGPQAEIKARRELEKRINATIMRRRPTLAAASSDVTDVDFEDVSEEED